MRPSKLTFIVLFVLTVGGCATYEFTAADGQSARPARPAASVAVFHTLPSGRTYEEVGVLEVDASSFAEAREHFQTLGGENGCHAVRAFDTRVTVAGARNSTWSVTTFLGSCLVLVPSSALTLRAL